MITTTLRERPILYSGPMVRAILKGLKTQTRRVVKGVWTRDGDESGCWDEPPPCPYGKPGDRLWVRETFYCDDYRYPDGPIEEFLEVMEYRASHDCSYWEAGCPCNPGKGGGPGWRPSIFMPRWACRITLEITEVRVERAHDISDADILAEGIAEYAAGLGLDWSTPARRRGLWEHLWDGVNAERDGGRWAWSRNPWTWVIGFKAIEGQGGEPR